MRARGGSRNWRLSIAVVSVGNSQTKQGLHKVASGLGVLLVPGQFNRMMIFTTGHGLNHIEFGVQESLT